MTTTHLMTPAEEAETRQLVEAWLKFKTGVEDIYTRAKSIAVELAFESSIDEKTHSGFSSDEVVFYKDIKINPVNNRIMFEVPSGAKDKYFYTDEADVIQVVADDDTTESLAEHITSAFKNAFDGIPTMRTVKHLEAKVKAFPDLVGILNDPETYVKETEKSAQRGTLYTKLNNFGIY